MKNFGYKAEFVDIDSEITKDDGNPVVENKIVKTTKKKGVKFNKNGIHMATFPIDKSVPSDHNLYEWSGCNEKTSNDENNLKIEFYITLCGLRNGERKGVDRKILMEEKPLFIADNEDLPKAINVMNSLLKYPEGKMLIYSIFLNQSSYMYYQAGKKMRSKYYEEGDYRVQTNDTFDLTITYFHELCHYLPLSGQNWFRYCFEYHKDVKADTSELDKNGKLIVKYWDEVYSKRKEYRLSLIHLLLNDLFRYSSEDTRIGSLSEILATSWNNLGKDYYGNHLCENLLRYRIYGKIRDNHTKLYYYEKLGKWYLRFHSRMI